jgi:hypothetical protein
MKVLTAVILGFSLTLGLTGCKADRDDDRSYVEIGEARVYDTPREVAGNRRGSVNVNESVPAPQALPELAQKSEHSRSKVTRARSYVTIGEMEPD